MGFGVLATFQPSPPVQRRMKQCFVHMHFSKWNVYLLSRCKGKKWAELICWHWISMKEFSIMMIPIHRFTMHQLRSTSSRLTRAMFVRILKECPFAFLCSSHLVAVWPELTCCKQALLCYSAFSELSLAWKHFESCCKREDFLKFGEIFAKSPWLAQWQVFWLACCILFIGRWSEALDAVLLILASQVVFGSHIPMSFVSSHSLCHSFCPYAHEGLRFMCSLHHCGGFLRVFWRRDCRICIICWWIFVPTESFWMRSIGFSVNVCSEPVFVSFCSVLVR